MIYVSAYNSSSLDDNSNSRYKESGITYITLSDTDEDISAKLNAHIFGCGPSRTQPTWDRLPLCLRTDWKRLKWWQIEEGDVLTEALQQAFDEYFDKPLIACNVLARLGSYAKYLHNTEIENLDYGRNLHCLNKDEYFTLEWAFSTVDQFNDAEGLRRFREAIIVGSIDDAISNVIWNYHH